MRFIIFYFFLPIFVNAEALLECKTEKHVGLNFLGKDYDEILNYIQLKNFNLKLDRTRKHIFEEEKQKLKNNLALKSSHFIEIILLKSSGYSIPMHCSWIFDIRSHQINQRDFSCIGHPHNDRVFSLDFNGNFMYSSRFEEFFPKKKNNKTLHSLIGVCK